MTPPIETNQQKKTDNQNVLCSKKPFFSASFLILRKWSITNIYVSNAYLILWLPDSHLMSLLH